MDFRVFSAKGVLAWATLNVNSFSVASIPTRRFQILLLFTTNHNLVTTKDFKSLGATHLHYKLELTSRLKESLAAPGNQMDAAAVEAAYVLAITEVKLSPFFEVPGGTSIAERTLAFQSSCIGNNVVATAHFKGLTALINTLQSSNPEVSDSGKLLVKNLFV